MATFASAARPAAPSRIATRRLAARANPAVAGASFVHARARVPRARQAVVSGYYCGAGEDMERYDKQAKEDDARQYGVWGVDGIRQRSSSFAAMEEEWEDAVSAVWTAAGASEVAVQRLLILGAKWQKGAQAEIYRDPEAVSRVIASLESLLPGVHPAAVFHGEPSAALICVDRSLLSSRLVVLRASVGIPRLDLARVVSKDPTLLTVDPTVAAATFSAASAALRDAVGWLLDEQGVASVAEMCPSMLRHEAEDVRGAFEGYRGEIAEKLEGVKGWSAALLAAVDEGAGTRPGGTTKGGGAARGRTCPLTVWESLGEEAKEAATRASIDYAGRVVEPHLRRERVRREKAEGAGGAR